MRTVRTLRATKLAALLLAASSSLCGAATLPDITTVGAGGDTCKQWTQAIKEPSARYQYRQWIFGFISGYNWRDSSKQVVPPDSTALLSWVDEFCKANPDAPIYIAASRLARLMEKPAKAGEAGKKPETKR
ncbi:MAG TPA: hypothetical protein VKH64_01155 [Candidatus Binatia bacterium]|nr:hypothetical protein [Candidatus Binatia bacterium]